MNYKAKILCYGDSNTYGYDPRGIVGYRYPAEHRWVDLLSEHGYHTVNEGMNGREFPTTKGSYKSLGTILKRNMDADILTIMLGSNDIFSIDPLEYDSIISRIENMYINVPLLEDFNKLPKRTILISPPPYKQPVYGREDVVEFSQGLHIAYEKYAVSKGLYFLDCGKWNLDMAFDGDHLSEEGHKTFADRIASAIDTILE